MTDIESKIKSGAYKSASYALNAIHRSSGTKKQKAAWVALVNTHYPADTLTVDPLSESATFHGTPQPTVVKLAMSTPYGKFAASNPLNDDVTALALRTLIIAHRHHLSREQLFDLVKERIQAEMADVMRTEGKG